MRARPDTVPIWHQVEGLSATRKARARPARRSRREEGGARTGRMGMAAEATDATIGPSRRGLRRGTLTRDMILAESLRLLDEDGVDGFSLPKLGRALGADQTAVYRHFASKDDLVLAVADELIEEAMAGLAPHECWLDTVADGVRRLRQTYARHPAAASLAACRTTQRPAEMRAVDALIGAVLDGGFTGAEAARIYRAVGDFALSW